MLHQIQPIRGSCLVTSFAMLLSIPVQLIFDYFGYDGSEIIYPNLPEPFCFRGFHPQELIDFVYNQYNLKVMKIESFPALQINNDNRIYEIFSYKKATIRLNNYLNKNNAVLTGTINNRRHAVFWNKIEKKVFDPNGTVYSVERFNIENAWII